MSPVHSIPSSGSRIRRRRVSPPAPSLFAVGPDAASPNLMVGEPAPLANPSSGARRSAAGCPPSHVADAGTATRPDSSGLPQFRTPAAPLVGIARLASISPAAQTRRHSAERPEYFLLPVRSILNRCNSARVPFEWTVNPYRGCEFACRYCYARYTHEFMELDGRDFEKKIFVKQDAAALLSREVSGKYCRSGERPNLDHPEHIAIGTATDPYQPAEREYGVTRACLEELVKREGLSVSITTKSNQVVRDIDLLQKIAARSALYINMTITTLRPRLARWLEPRAPRPDLRIAALRQLCDAGIPAGVLASPLLPGITDGAGELEALAETAKNAGAQWFASGILFLQPTSAKHFMPALREKFPRLAKQYEDWFIRQGQAPEPYRKSVRQRLSAIRRKLGYPDRPYGEMQAPVASAQLSIAWHAPDAARGASPGALAGTESGHDDFIREASRGDDQQHRPHGKKREPIRPQMLQAGAA
jgi:DNA repair photolyase